MSEIPIVRLTIEHMRHQILHAFSVYTEELKTRVEKVVNDVIQHFNYETEIRKLAEEIFRDQVKRMLQSAFWRLGRDQGLRQALVETLVESMKTEWKP